MSGTQQTELLNSGLDCFQDPDRAKHSVRHLLMGIALILPGTQSSGCEILVFMSKKHLHINVKCDRACSEFQERAEPSVGDSRTSVWCCPCHKHIHLSWKAAAMPQKCEYCRSDPNGALTALTPAQHFPWDVFATFAISALPLTDSLHGSNVDTKLQNTEEHKPCFWHTA